MLITITLLSSESITIPKGVACGLVSCHEQLIACMQPSLIAEGLL